VASTAIANYLLPQRLAALRRQQPDCRLSLHVANTRDIVAAVLDCVVDFGLMEGPCQHPELEVIPWLDDSEAINRAAAGLGVSCLSRRVVAELLASGALVALRADLPALTRTLWRIHRRNRPPGRGCWGWWWSMRCQHEKIQPNSPMSRGNKAKLKRLPTCT